MEKLKAVPVAHKKDDLFVAIITSEDEKTLVAQCTSLVLARHLVDLHNSSLTQRALDAACACSNPWFLEYEDGLHCKVCGKPPRQ